MNLDKLQLQLDRQEAQDQCKRLLAAIKRLRRRAVMFVVALSVLLLAGALMPGTHGNAVQPLQLDWVRTDEAIRYHVAKWQGFCHILQRAPGIREDEAIKGAAASLAAIDGDNRYEH